MEAARGPPSRPGWPRAGRYGPGRRHPDGQAVERTAGRVAPTIPDEVAARFISVVGDGLLLQQAILGEVPHARAVIALATTALTTAPPHREV
jgi:hypothetical protein